MSSVNEVLAALQVQEAFKAWIQQLDSMKLQQPNGCPSGDVPHADYDQGFDRAHGADENPRESLVLNANGQESHTRARPGCDDKPTRNSRPRACTASSQENAVHTPLENGHRAATKSEQWIDRIEADAADCSEAEYLSPPSTPTGSCRRSSVSNAASPKAANAGEADGCGGEGTSVDEPIVLEGKIPIVTAKDLLKFHIAVTYFLNVINMLKHTINDTRTPDEQLEVASDTFLNGYFRMCEELDAIVAGLKASYPRYGSERCQPLVKDTGMPMAYLPKHATVNTWLGVRDVQLTPDLMNHLPSCPRCQRPGVCVASCEPLPRAVFAANILQEEGLEESFALGVEEFAALSVAV